MIALHLRQLLTASPAMIIKHLLVLACTTAVATMASAQSAATDPVGFTTAALLGESDSAISLPFVRPPVFVGGIQATSGNTITVSGSPVDGKPVRLHAGNPTEPLLRAHRSCSGCKREGRPHLSNHHEQREHAHR
jgi:hypothetical protein